MTSPPLALRILQTFAASLGLLCGAHGQVLATATLEGTYTQPVNGNWQAVHVSATQTSLVFSTTARRQKVVISYSTTCLAGGFVALVRANIDGLVASPGANGVSLCSSPGVGADTYPASRTFVVTPVSKGAHTVAIEVKGSGAAMLIGESALVVSR